MGMTIAAQVADAGMSRAYAPWWVWLAPVGRGDLSVKCWDADVREHEIDETTGAGVLARRVTSAELRAARAQAERDDATCCERGMYCAEDADQILQRAVYGRTVFG